ncbi:MAG: hypothetical protein WC869_04925 [Phycisphaerae bacterium]|jgi:hypothetical protein
MKLSRWGLVGTTVACLLAAAIAAGTVKAAARTATSSPAKSAVKWSAKADEGSFTILLFTFPGSDHVKNAAQGKEETAKYTKWKNLQVVNKADTSDLIMGRFRSPREAEPTLKKVRAYKTPANIQLFAHAILIPVPGTDFGPPEWNILKTNAAFSVAMAEFYDVPEASYVGRKKLAVDCVSLLRKDGEEAYYYHGPVKSIVCVGCFTEEDYPAVWSAGKRTREIRNARIKEILAKHLKLAVNGVEELVVLPGPDNSKQKFATASYILEIPREEAQKDASFNRTGNAEPRKNP